MKKELKKGDYVLATKYSDGDPQDHFVVGFLKSIHKDRFIVVDEEGNSFRASGFRRAEKITKARGAFIISKLKDIEQGSASVWFYKTCAM